MHRKKLIVLAAIALLSLIATAWIAVGAIREVTRAEEALHRTREILITLEHARGGEIVTHLRSVHQRRLQEQTTLARSARQFAMYAPWAMCSIAVIVFVLMMAEVNRALRAELFAREQEHAAFEKAKEADQLKEQFLATVSHELRTPLTAIIGWCGVLQNASSRSELLDQGLAGIADAARVQSQLVEDLLDISRIAAGRIDLSLAEVDAADVLESAIGSVALPAREKSIAIRKRFEPAARMIVGDSMRLQQVVSNLLSNSIKFSPPGTTVEIHLRSSASHAEISVHDDGEGIEPELLPHIFDRFRQGTSARGRHAGLGLGLSIVKNLVELHGGTVCAESAGKGKGSTFTVRLPLAPKTGISPNAQRMECANASSRFPSASRNESASWRSRTPDAAR